MALLYAKDIKKSYHLGEKESVILDGINLSFDSPGIYLLLGKSGSGKSTLLNILLGLEEADYQTLVYQERSMRKANDFINFRALEAGIIFQENNLISHLSVKENILLPMSIIRCDKKEVKTRYDDLIKLLNLEKTVKTPVMLLSGGEKQRVSLARVLIKNPTYIFADEPTGALDQNNTKTIMEMFSRIKEDHLILMITHNKDLANNYGDQILHLENRNILIEKKDELKQELNIKKIKRKKLSFKCSIKYCISALKKGRIRLLLGMIFSSIVFSLLLVLLGINHSYPGIVERISMNLMDSNIFEVSQVEKEYNSKTQLTLIKKMRPGFNLLKKIDFFDDSRIEYNLASIFSNAKLEYQSMPLNNFLLRPIDTYIFNDVKDLEIVYLNQKAAEEINSIKEGESIFLSVSNRFDYRVGEQVISDYCNLRLKLDIGKIVNEKTLFEQPVIYYSYYGLKKWAMNNYLSNLSSKFNRQITWFQRISEYASNDDEITSYSLLVLFNQKESAKRLIKSFQSEYLEVTSRAFEHLSRFSSLFYSINELIGIFLILSLLLTGALLFSILFLRLNERGKEIGILQSLGFNKKEVGKIFYFESLFLSLGIYILTIIIYQNLEKLLNYGLDYFFCIEKSFSLKNYSLSVILLFFLITFTLNIATFIPLNLMQKKRTINLLKGGE